MNKFILQRFKRSLLFARYYFLVALFVVIALIITSIARAIQTKDEAHSQIISSVLNSYKKLQNSRTEPIILESVSELELIAEPSSHQSSFIESSQNENSLESDKSSSLKNEAMDNNEIELISTSSTSPILHPFGAISEAVRYQSEKDRLTKTTPTELPTSDMSDAIHDDITNIINQNEKPSSATELLVPDTILNKYLMFTLFPHRKSEIVEEPIARPYKEHTHIDDLTVMKFANKIDASLSISEDSMYEEYGTAEAFFDENYDYYEGFDEYEDHEFGDEIAEKQGTAVIQGSNALVFPYIQNKIDVVEAESTFDNFEDQPVSQQIEQLITTGDYYLLSNDPVKARQHYVRAVQTGAVDKSSPFYAKALVKLADMEDNPYLARFQYTNALDIYRSYQDFDMEIANILVKLVWTFDMATERIVIYELLTQAKQIHEEHSYTPQYTEVLRNLAIYYETVNDFEKADANYKAALALDLQHLSTQDIRTILALENYAAFYLKFNEFKKAEEILLFKLEAHEALSPPDYYNLGRTQSMLGWTYLQLNELDESLHNYNSALGNINYSINKNRFAPHYYSLPAIFDLIYFFVDTKEPELAAPYFDVAVALLESEGEEDVISYLADTDFDDIDPDRVVNYPWAAKAEIKGLISIIKYIQSTQN